MAIESHAAGNVTSVSPHFYQGASGDGRATNKLSVLLVEDDQSAQRAMTLLLRHYEYEVKSAGTVAQGMQLVHEMRPGLVLLDLKLPDGNGIRIFQEIRDLKLDSRVFVVTSEHDSELLRRTAALKPEAILPKPLNFIALLQRMRGSQVE